MSHRKRALRGAVAAIILGTWLLPLTGSAEEALEDHFSRDWYYTELIVFQRPEVQDHAAEEALTRQPAPLPASLRSLRTPPGAPAADYPVARAMRPWLTFPYLDWSLLPAPVQDAQLEFETRESSRFRDDLEDLVDDRSTDDAEGAEPDARPAAGAVPPPAIEPRLAPDPLLDFLAALAAFEERLEADSYRWLPPESFTLAAEASQLARRGGYQILLHGRWLQPVPPREAPQPVYLRSGPRFGDSHALEGTVAVTLGRYLHFNAGLYFTEPLLGKDPLSHAIAPPAAGPTGQLSPVTPRLTLQDLQSAGFMQLRESRRVRSGELHYLDHPKLGVLLRIEAVTPPPELSAAHVALEEGAE